MIGNQTGELKLVPNGHFVFLINNIVTLIRLETVQLVSFGNGYFQ